MLARRGFLWLLAATLAGLLPALLLAGHVAHAALEAAALARLAREAASLAAAQAGPQRPALPPGAVLLSATGLRLAGDAEWPEAALQRAASLPGPAALPVAEGLLALHPLADGNTLALWQPAARLQARLGIILLHGLRDAGLLLLLCLPAGWMGARLLLAPLGAAALGAAGLLDALRAADLAAEQAEASFDPAPAFAAAAAEADPLMVAAAEVAAGSLLRIDATAAAMLGAEAEEIPG